MTNANGSPEQPDFHNDNSANQNLTQEALQQGIRELAGNISQIAANGEPGAVKDYMDDLLADPENSAPQNERLAAFTILSHEQRNEIRGETLKAGAEMIDNLFDKTKGAKGALDESGRKAEGSIKRVPSAHDELVGNTFRGGGVDTRRIDRGQEEVSGVLRRSQHSTSEHMDNFSRWSKGQSDELEMFLGAVHKSKNHEHALDEAAKVVDPSVETEPKDLSNVIDDEIKESVAAKLESAVSGSSESGHSPEDNIAEMLNAESVDPRNIKAVVDFSVAYDDELLKAKRAKGEMEDANRLYSRFASEGRDGYRYVRRAEEATELFQTQRRRLSQASEQASGAIKRTQNTFKFSGEQLQRMQAKLAEVKKSDQLSEA